jgi:hypothetical protein
VALVGRELAGDENLSLRYLAGALSSAGHEAVVIPLNGPASLPAAAERIEKIRADILGLSLPDADITIDALAFVRYVRQAGYSGHVTCGGPLATLVRHELLDKHRGIDSVIRHDGEVPLTMLADAIATGGAWQDIPGISTRSGDGPPAPVADPTSLGTRPVHADPLPKLLGVGTARLSASRGCPGRCPYCGPAALQRDAIRDARKAGLGRDELRSANVGKTRHRHYVGVAEEVAELYHRSGARFFQVVDENLLSGGTERAEAWLTGLMGELARRKVGRTAWCIQADPATLTPTMMDLLVELGVIRVSVGIEGLTTKQLRALGRWGEATDHIEILETLRRRGIVTSFNSLIVHPLSSMADIEREIDALAALSPIHFDVLSMAVYPGTQAYHSLLREGRVTGGMLGLRFEPADIAVNRFRAALIRLRMEAIGRYGVNTYAHDVAINVALAGRLGLPGYQASMARTIESALDDLNRARVRALMMAAELAKAEVTDAERESAMAGLVSSLRRDLQPSWQGIGNVQERLELGLPSTSSSPNLMFASAMATSFILCLSSATACGGKTTGTSGSPDTAGDASPRGGAGGSAQTSAGGSPGRGGQAPIFGSGGSLPPLPGSGGVVVTPPCNPSVDRQRAWDSVFKSQCPACQGTDPYGISIDASGRVVDVMHMSGAPIPDAVRRCYMDALSNQTFPCLNGEDIWYECVVTLK